MSKAKSRDTIRIQNKKCNKKHNIPRELCDVLERLEGLEFVKHIGIGKFTTTSNNAGIKIIGYDDNSRSYCVKVKVKNYEQKLFVEVEGKKYYYERKILDCF